jgi:ABC-2 type transport system permease protein
VTARTVLLLARRELVAALPSRTVVSSTLLALLALAGFVLLTSTVLTEDNRTTIGLNGQTIAMAGPLTDGARDVGQQVRTIDVTDLDAGAGMVASGKLDALVSGTPAAPRVLVRTSLNADLVRVLNGLAQQQVLRAQLAAVAQVSEDIDPQAVLASVAGAHISLRALTPADPAEHERTALGLTVGAVVFGALLLFGTLLARSVIADKAAGRIELLVTTVRIGQLAAGKTLGYALLGLGQLGLLGVVGIGATAATGIVTDVSSAITTVLSGLLFFVLGFLLCATVFVPLAALASRREDTPAVLTPVYIGLVVLFAVGFFVLARDPESGPAAVLSLVPPLSPVLLPGRIALDLAAWWQPVLAVLLTAGLTALLARPAARLYRESALHEGARRSLWGALRTQQ